MGIRNKFLIVSLLLSLVPAIALAGYIAYTSYQEGRSLIDEMSRKHLISIRETKKSQIESYFQTIESQILSFSKDRMIVNAAREFRQAFDQYRDERGSFDESGEKAKVERYYREEFASEYNNRNADTAPSVSGLMSSLDEDSIAFQHDFIAANPKPLGQKDGLISLENQTLYSKLHEIYHPAIRDFLQRFEYYDIFLVAPDTGDIIYSVFKELDFSTSLIDGPYADSGIGRVFRQVRNASN